VVLEDRQVPFYGACNVTSEIHYSLFASINETVMHMLVIFEKIKFALKLANYPNLV
jgi:hypothetical protein